jgi:lipopolysaccharide/colanic/teichoic acid biosynthesis glycosyltransferase
LKARLFRVFDVVGATVLLVLALPLITLVAMLIVLESPGRVLVRHRQIRPGGGDSVLLKFRTGPMVGDYSGTYHSRLGSLLRTTGLDELPMLISIVRGDLPILGRCTWRQFLAWLNSTDR